MKRMITLTALAPLALGYANAASTAKPAAKPPKPEPVEPEVVTGTMPEGFTPPEPKRSGGATKYPIDDLATGAFFGVKNKTKRDMTGIVNRANTKYSTRAKDPSTGKNKVLSTEREFYAVDVDQATAKSLKGSDFEGSTVLVVRRK